VCADPAGADPNVGGGGVCADSWWQLVATVRVGQESGWGTGRETRQTLYSAQGDAGTHGLPVSRRIQRMYMCTFIWYIVEGNVVDGAPLDPHVAGFGIPSGGETVVTWIELVTPIEPRVITCQCGILRDNQAIYEPWEVQHMPVKRLEIARTWIGLLHW
jgi:hypothetical protein